MRKVVLIFSILLIGFTTQAQDDGPVFSYAVSNNELDLAEVGDQPIPRDPFGDDMAKMMVILKNNYTFVEPPTPTKPTPTTVVEKPTIYFAIKRAHKLYKKMVKKDQVSEDEAIQNLTELIQKAVNVRYQKTESLEEALRGAKKLDEIESIFSNIEFRS